VRRALLALIAVAVSAVATGATPLPAPAAPPLPALRRCVGSAFTPAPVEPWLHPRRARVRVALGPANHAVQDVLATPGAPATIRAKLAYGAASKDLEDERVRVFLDACSGFRRLAELRTDDEGRIAVPVPATLAPGVYDVRIEVLGDGSVAPGRVFILPRGTRLAVTDIDGTLTTADEEMVKDVAADLFRPIVAGAHVPAAYPGAAALTNALAARGYVVVFLTGRPYWLAGKTREWLSSGGFAAGPLHLADSNAEAVPNAGGVGAFKRAYLRSLAAAGFALEEAYGNATTDVSAYAGAGIPRAATWIIGPNGGAGGTQAVSASWEPRAAAVAAMPLVAQPFAPPSR
jgi:phosphoserine phosphatase